MTQVWRGAAATAYASRYLQQLCKHWSHKFPVDNDKAQGTIELSGGRVTLAAEPHSLVVRIKPAPEADAARLRQVVEQHIDRFAFREAPLAFEWKEEEASL